jgi:branched-chain amino acid transport system permease protein
VVLLAIILIIIQRMENSRFGFRLRALRQNETAAEGMGINIHKTKLMAFMLSAALGSIVGTVYAFGILYILTTHSIFGLFIIVRILSIAIVGGLGSLWGPFIASVILVPIGEILNSQVGDRYPGVQDIIYGAALIAAIIYFPEGIWGKAYGFFHRLPQRRASEPAPIPIEPSQARIEVMQKSQPAQALHLKNEEPILKIEGVYKAFGGVIPLVEVNIDVPQGKVMGIIGPNGAGKTTLFNVINGYLTPEKGRILFKGEDVTGLKPNVLCKMGIGRTFQTPQIFNKMTIMENVLIGAFAKEVNSGKARAIADKIAQQIGFSQRARDQAIGLSIWETKTLEFARALATQPELLLVDEPMAGLNIEETDRIGQIIKGIADGGVTVIVIEHVVQSLVKIADLMVGLDEGRKVAEGTPEEVTSNPHIIEAYVGAKWRDRYAKR